MAGGASYADYEKALDALIRERTRVSTAAWDAWFHQLGEALVDGGNPASGTKVISADGSVAAGGATSPSGYSIIKADSHDAAVGLAKGCPVLAGGAMIEVVETFNAM